MKKILKIGAAKFKAKPGKPAARLGRVNEGGRQLHGALKGSVKIHGDLTEPLDVEWEALSR